MDYVQMTRDNWMSLKKEIKEEFIKASTSFVRIGYLLRKAEDSEGYKNDGYDSLTEWARDELGLTATYVSRFKAINAKYSADGYSDHLLPEFVGYGSAKLGEMLALPDEDMEMLTPEMKRSDIRALKEFNRQEPEAPDAESWILEMMEIIPAEVKKDLAKECLQGALDGKKCSDILNPSGNSMKRTRAAMVAMTDEGLFVKTFGPDGGRRKISWQDFAQMLCERYEKWKPQESVAMPGLLRKMPSLLRKVINLLRKMLILNRILIRKRRRQRNLQEKKSRRRRAPGRMKRWQRALIRRKRRQRALIRKTMRKSSRQRMPGKNLQTSCLLRKSQLRRRKNLKNPKRTRTRKQ